MAQIVLASRLGDGRVVFLAKGSTAGSVDWAALIQDAEVADSEQSAAELLSIGEADADARHLVVDPYLIDVEGEGRALGPTIRKDLGKQAEGAEA